MNKNLIIGLGGTGGKVLKEFRKRIYDEHGEISNCISFMYVDSSHELMRHDDPTWLTQDGYNAQFFESEYLDISLKYQIDSPIVFPEQFPNMKGIIENCERLKNYQPEAGAMQDRRLGRVLLGIHATQFDSMLKRCVRCLQEQTMYSGLNVTIVTGLSGGTGSGCVVSVIAYIARLFPNAQITVLGTLPTIPPPPNHDEGRYLANAYAVLRELNALNIGKLKLSDLVTGEKFQPELTYDCSLNYCHNLQENKLFKLFLFDHFHNEYDKIANILYHNLMLGKDNPTSAEYRRTMEMHNIIPAPENDASATEGQYCEAHTRAVGSFGLCRIVYPRKRILRYLAQSATIQAIWQMLYNNFKDGIGFVDEKHEFEPKTICQQYIQAWHLDYHSLTLQQAALAEDNRNARPFVDEWTHRMELYRNYKVAKKEAGENNTAYHNLAEYANRIYHEAFRSQQGAESYFSDKERIVTEYAKDICSGIERFFFSEWTVGKYGLYQLCEMCEALRDHLQEKVVILQKQSEELCQKADDLEKDCCLTLKDVGRMNQFQIRLKEFTGEMQKRYIHFQEILTLYYSERTEIASIEFAQHLIHTLLLEFANFKDRLESYMYTLKRLEENAQRKVYFLHPLDNYPDFNKNIIDLSNHQDVEHYKKFMFAEKEFMQQLTTQVRATFTEDQEHFLTLFSKGEDFELEIDRVQQHLIEYIIENDKKNSIAASIQNYLRRISPHFSSCINSGMPPSQFIDCFHFKESGQIGEAVHEWLKQDLKEAVKAFHELINVPYILKTNVLQELEMRFPTEDSLVSCIKQVLSAACDNIQLDDYETKRVVRNNPLPNDPWLRPYETILVRIPHAANEKEELTSERLTALFKANYGITHVEIDTEASDAQEISVACVRTSFPIRYIKSLADLKQQYDSLMSNKGTQAANMLHTEDAFKNLPSLEIETDTEQLSTQKEKVTDELGVPLPPQKPRQCSSMTASMCKNW